MCATAQLVDDGTVFNFFKYIAWLAFAREAGKTCAARTNAPGGHSDFKCCRQIGQLLDIESVARQGFTQRVIVVLESVAQFCVFFGNQ